MNAGKTFLATTGNSLARAAINGTGSWAVEFLLTGQDVRCLAVDPLDTSIVYAGTQGNGVLRSDDLGQSWQQAGLPGIIVKSLAVSKSEPGAVYAGTKSPPAIFVSRDKGANWSELESFRNTKRWYWVSPAEPPFSAYVQAIALSPVNPNVIVAGIEAGAVVRSEDGGQTWTGHRKGAIRDCHSMQFHSSNGEWIYEAGGGGAAVSQDAGQTWQQPRKGLDRRYGWACAADPSRPEVWYASISKSFSFPRFEPAAHIDGQANAYIFRSSGGAPWEKLAGGLPQPLDYMAYALLTDPAAPGHLYAGLSNGDIWFSADYGDAWEKLPLNLGGIHRTLVMLN
jgi:photosystem II stability/assembly factor-like uncharacterized protein